MMTYTRRGKASDNQTPSEPTATGQKQEAKGKKVDGIQQVVDMLSAADPEFRKSLLQRIMAENSTLAKDLQVRLKGLRK